MFQRSLTVLAVAVALNFLSAANGPAMADPDECQDAITHYNTAKSDLADALPVYVNCLSDSKGHDDCSAEFSQLQSAQSDFEDAVSEYQSDCD